MQKYKMWGAIAGGSGLRSLVVVLCDSFVAIAQTSQLRQTPTENFVKAINKTPTNPATKPIPLANNGIETLKVNPVAIAKRCCKQFASPFVNIAPAKLYGKFRLGCSL